MDTFVRYLDLQWNINKDLDDKHRNWIDFVRTFRRVYKSEMYEISSYHLYSIAYSHYNLDTPPLSGSEYEIRKLIGHLYSLGAHSPSVFDLGLAFKGMNRSEREFDGICKLNVDRLIEVIKHKAQMISKNKIDLIKLSEDLFHWEFQSNATNKNYIIQKWVDSYCRGEIHANSK